jgi:hypothetical protein
MVNASVFALGWLLYVLAQAQNSLKSSSNGLTGWPGWAKWLKLHFVDLLTRAFFSFLAYSFILHTVSDKAQALGFPVTSTTMAGLGGFLANTLLYQFFGLVGLRVEVGELAPPPAMPKP